MASPNLSELVTTTARNRSKKLADNVSKGNALLQRLDKIGNNRSAAGGRTIVEELEYAENATFKYYAGYETLDITPSDVISAAEFNWKQAAVVISISGLEELQNAGKEQIINLLESRMKNGDKTMSNNISTGIYSDGTGTSGKQIGGLQLLVPNTPSTGTAGGINRATFTFWRNQVFDFSSASLGAGSAGVIQQGMRNLWIDCIRGNDKVDLITADKNYFEAYWDSLTDIQRITRVDEGNTGFETLKFLNADVIYDGDSGHPASTMYFLNTDYIHWRPHSARNMVPLERRMSVNQDAIVVPIVFAGNMTVSNAARQGVLHG